MAGKRDIEVAQTKLRIKSDLLKARVQEMDAKEKRQQLRKQLQSMGGRVRV